MLFNSLNFLLFFTVVFSAFVLIPQKYRWGLLLLASYFFYGCWNKTYLVLIFTTTFSTYIFGLLIDHADKNSTKKLYVCLVCFINFGLLAVFKYFNFFSASINSVFTELDIISRLPFLDVLLPVGISFYTFQAIGYIIDVYRKEIMPEKNIGIFSLYISFFPQLVAGPIERSKNLLPQLKHSLKCTYSNLTQGLVLILWGFFQKIVIADRLALYVNHVFAYPETCTSVQTLIAVYFFSIQIYCDFAGYSNIAIGSAKIFGINLMNNFDRPYFATSVQDFWRRWHISLSTWFRDYLYIPLGGSRTSDSRLIVNIMIVFLLCGLWHGAAWTFVIWGGLHGLLLCLYNIIKKKSSHFIRIKIPNIIKIFFTFHIVSFAWIFFRATSLEHAAKIFKNIFALNLQFSNLSHKTPLNPYEFKIAIISILCLIFIEKIQNDKIVFNEFWTDQPLILRWSISYLLFFGILLFGMYNLTEFIYFQF